MKNARKILATAFISMALLWSPIDTSANDIIDLEIMEDARIVRVAINSPIELPVELSLYNSFRREILNEKINVGETFESQIDFSEFRNGTYTLVSTTGNLRTHKVFDVKNSRVEMVDRYISYIPMFLQDDEALRVYHLNKAGSEIRVTVENDFYYFLETTYINDSGVFEKDFSLVLMDPGTYQLTLESNGELFTHMFRVD